MNVTDVGHLLSDGDEGEDKMEKAAKEQKKTPREIADRYTAFNIWFSSPCGNLFVCEFALECGYALA